MVYTQKSMGHACLSIAVLGTKIHVTTSLAPGQGMKLVHLLPCNIYGIVYETFGAMRDDVPSSSLISNTTVLSVNP